MPRPYVFQDPNNRSPNDPSIIVSSQQVLGLYNRANKEKMENVTEKVRAWFTSEAKKRGWSRAVFSGGQCVLTRDFQ